MQGTSQHREPSTGGESRFRISAWPGGPVDIPPVRVLPVEREDAWAFYGAAVAHKPLADELVLRGLLDLDLGDLDAVVRFVGEHGALVRYAGRLPGEVLAPPAPASLGDQPVPDHAVPVAELVAYLRTARALALHWVAFHEGARVHGAWQTEGLGDVLGADAEPGAWATWVDRLNIGLRPFHVRAELPVEWADHVVMGAPQADLYSALCLQLWNLAVEALPPRRCANETCHRPFVRQQGRAQFDQHRTEGVKYCSRECARAQANREYRRRKRAERDRKG